LPYSLEYIEKLQNLFVHLHVHSEYSNIRILDSINKIEDMILYVDSLGQQAMAITDHECLSGHVKFLNKVKELIKENKIDKNFKPILGNEIYLVDEETMHQEIEELGRTQFYHFLLLSKDNEGHEQLRKLSSTAWRRMFNYKGMDRVPTFYSDIEQIIGENKGHIIASSACLGGRFPNLVTQLIYEEDNEKQEIIKDKIDEFVNWCLDNFGEDDFYIELQPSLQQEQMDFNSMAIKIAKAYNLKWIITTDAHYLKEEDREIHAAYLTSEEDGNSNREVDMFYSTTHFFTVDKIFENMNYLDSQDIEKGILHTKEISDKIIGYEFAHKQIIPKIKLPKESQWYENKKLKQYVIDKNYIHILGMLNSTEIYDRYLMSLVFDGINNKIKKEDYEETFERIDIECKEIIDSSKAKEEPLSSYFVTMNKNIEIIWEEANSIVAPGRGSAGGYIIDYLTGITQINPLKQGVEMPHWRFISAERPDYPDIDIDVCSHKKDIVFEKIQNYYNSIGGEIVRVATFGTETAKSAVQTACRGLKINNDVGLYLSSLVPVERGKVWSISDCFYGNEKKGRKTVTEFRNMVSEYSDKNLLNVMLGIEGLINKRSSHACGVLIVNEEFTKYNAIMRTPSGEVISQYELHDSEFCGNLKYDFLNTKTCSMIQLTLEMLIKNNKIEWQGSLRKTYDKYLHPDIIDKENLDMWNILNQGELISAFQFDSNVGEKAIKMIQPTNLLQATDANNLMRLMGEDGKEQPLDMYVRYKTDINEWYKDMKNLKLTDEEIKIVEKHLLKNYGVCSTQEGMMMLSMDENIAGFNVVESNILRKGVAKKIGETFQKAHDLLYEKGKQLGTSKNLLDYIWDVQIAMQRGYGFSLLHGIEYTYILIQQLNLVCYYPSIYWNTAVLLVESGAVDRELSEDSKLDTKEKTTNYGEVAKAIGKLQSKGVKISLPYINQAEQGFLPNEENNEIIFGFKGIMKINNDTSQIIMENRPYKSLKDFHERLVLIKREVTLKTGKKQMKSLVPEGQTIMLIKAGTFDKIENKPREEILENYLQLLNPPKKKLNVKDIAKLSEMGVIPSELKDELRLYNFRNYITSTYSKIQDKETKSIVWYKIHNKNDEVMTEYATNFFMEHFANEMQENKDYRYDENGSIVVALGTSRKGSFEDIYSKKINKLNEWLKTQECVDTYNSMIFDNIKKDNMQGNISSWEMESMNYYYHEHELTHVNKEKYNIVDFNLLSEEPTVVGFTKYKGLQYPKFQLDRIVGTVLDRDKNKHSVTILTPSGVVVLKFYSGQFSFYDKTISMDNGADDKGNMKKIVLENGWFQRGTKLLITGFRRGDQFKPKRYRDSIYQHAVQKIIEIKDNGDLILQGERTQIPE